jgi:hypothetical protein
MLSKRLRIVSKLMNPPFVRVYDNAPTEVEMQCFRLVCTGECYAELVLRNREVAGSSPVLNTDYTG